MADHNKKIVGELCNYLGQDLDHPMCQELLQHLNECPECRFYVDTVKMTVSLCRKTFENKPVPDHVRKRLFHTLKLDDQK